MRTCQSLLPGIQAALRGLRLLSCYLPLPLCRCKIGLGDGEGWQAWSRDAEAALFRFETMMFPCSSVLTLFAGRGLYPGHASTSSVLLFLTSREGCSVHGVPSWTPGAFSISCGHWHLEG